MRVLITGLILCSLPLAIHAQTTVELEATRDNTLYESVTGAASNGMGDVLFTGITANGDLLRTILAFDDLTQIPAGATITDVTLGLEVTKTIAGSETFTLHRVMGDWGEGGSLANGNAGTGAPSANGDATWIHRFFPDTFWDNPGGDFEPEASASVVLAGNGDYVVESTEQLAADVEFWRDNPELNFGWILMGDESAGPPTAKRLSSREGISPPLLTITYQQAAPIDVALLTGLWFDPLLDGEGYVVFLTENGLLIQFFGFDADGNRLWLISEVIADEFNLGDTLTLNMVVADEGTFSEPADPSTFVVYGTLEARFDTCTGGVFVLDGRDGVKISQVSKLARLRGAEC